jgi:hypothetical protein
MQITLRNITNISDLEAGPFDLREEFGMARLVEEGEKVTLFLNSAPCRSWLKQDHPHIRKIKWLDLNRVILYFDASGAAIVSVERWNNIRFGFISKLFVSDNYIFVSYTDESFFRSRPDELESNIISVFSHDGNLQFGLRDLLEKCNDLDDLFEIDAFYTYGDNIVFVGAGSDCVWNLAVSQRNWKKVPFELWIVGIKVLTGDDKAAYAIFDNRWCLDRYPDRPPFELAVFDLVAETSSKQEFAPVGAALTDAGFAMSKIKFQPNSTGRIMVSDLEKAALLEFSGVP